MSLLVKWSSIEFLSLHEVGQEILEEESLPTVLLHKALSGKLLKNVVGCLMKYTSPTSFSGIIEHRFQHHYMWPFIRISPVLQSYLRMTPFTWKQDQDLTVWLLLVKNKKSPPQNCSENFTVTSQSSNHRWITFSSISVGRCPSNPNCESMATLLSSETWIYPF